MLDGAASATGVLVDAEDAAHSGDASQTEAVATSRSYVIYYFSIVSLKDKHWFLL